jgi:8-oxo-dGTP diphosphatase/2-hydroxy-dATP diphosphatase
MKKLMTLVLVDNGEAILLGLKKRGFGEGRWNGFGGKVESGETLLEAAKRELKEEVGIEATGYEQVGILNFSFESDAQTLLEVNVFRITNFTGEPMETEEMKPKWFAYQDIPYAKMWPDDAYWLPLVLEGRRVKGSFHFDAPASLTHVATSLSHEVHAVEGF